MNQEKIGKFIAELRKEKKMTQQELADKLNVTDRAVSHWENGRRLPDYSLLKELCDILSISINELFAGEKISNEDYKKKADENLMKALENSSFSLKEKIAYYKKKWKKEHISTFVVAVISWIVLVISLKIKNVDFYLIGTIGGLLALLFYIVLYNRMMIYVENNAYKKIEK
nr:helix-turn-helix domain-containing protein [Bacilli bacterium]